MAYDPTLYEGAAAHYRHGRPAYSPQLEALLTRELNLDGTGRLLDAGCGPGILTVRFAHLFKDAVGLDPDPAMLAEGHRLAEELSIMNWTDEARVAEVGYDMLEPGGSLALIVHTVESRPEPPNPGAPPIPHAEIKALVQKYLGSAQRAGRSIAPVRTHRFQDVLVCTRFDAPRSTFAPGIPNLLRDSESVLSGYFSMSSSAPHLFGQRVEDFADEVRELLRARSPQGIFWDWPGDTEVILARRPS